MKRDEAENYVGKMVMTRDPGNKLVPFVAPHGPYLFERITKAGKAMLKDYGSVNISLIDSIPEVEDNHPFKKELIESLTQEFIDHEGHITCEISVHQDNLAEFCRTIREENKKLREATNGKKVSWYWEMFPCETCAKHHGEDCFMHAQITNNRY